MIIYTSEQRVGTEHANVDKYVTRTLGVPIFIRSKALIYGPNTN